MPALPHPTQPVAILPSLSREPIAESSVQLQRARGRGELIIRNCNGVSSVERLYQQGCAKIRLPRRSDGVREAVLINSSGGATGGDQLDWSVQTEQDTHTMVTTQACERVYKTPRVDDSSTVKPAVVNIELSVGKRAKLAWLPQETLFFDQGALARTLTANLDDKGELLIVEPIIFGRQAMGERVDCGELRDRWRIYRKGKLLHGEDLVLTGDLARQIAEPMILDGRCAIATLLFISPRAEGFVNALMQVADHQDGISAWNGKLLARVTAKDGYQLRKKLVAMINMLNFEAPVPKVWSL